ncbi:MAG: XdhC family protein [Burkholderiaceae bacterium]|nr:XdhC family protein [Burkholderiaceae bacterium]
MTTPTLDVLAALQRLNERDEPFALVSVLRVQPPASARPGDKAVVTRDGFAAGWIGGGCAQPAVLRTVKLALADGRARMIRIAPNAEGAEPRELDDVLEFGMACHSGGTLELFIDPVLPKARLVVIGDSPVAVALAGLAPRVGLAVTVLAQGADTARFADAALVLADDGADAAARAVAPGAFVVVATQGRRDVQGLRCALALAARQVWLVASARKAQVLKDSLVAAGADATAVAAIVAPAGQRIAEQMGAHTPEEVALSVLAAVVAARRRGTVAGVSVDEPAAAAASGAPEPARSLATATLATTASQARPAIAPLPDLPPIAASCCGGGAAASELPVPALAGVAPAAGKPSCCGS